MDHERAFETIALQLGIINNATRFEDRLNGLAVKINDLLNHDFQELISVLYRMDINEGKLRRLLEENKDADAGLIIANLMIEREVQKMISRKNSANRSNDINDEEKW